MVRYKLKRPVYCVNRVRVTGNTNKNMESLYVSDPMKCLEYIMKLKVYEVTSEVNIQLFQTCHIRNDPARLFPCTRIVWWKCISSLCVHTQWK